jgi:hypothetical protein
MAQPVENTMVNARRERRGRGSRRRLTQPGILRAVLGVDFGFDVPLGLAITHPILPDEPEQVPPRVATMLYAVRIVEGVSIGRVKVRVKTESHIL